MISFTPRDRHFWNSSAFMRREAFCTSGWRRSLPWQNWSNPYTVPTLRTSTLPAPLAASVSATVRVKGATVELPVASTASRACATAADPVPIVTAPRIAAAIRVVVFILMIPPSGQCLGEPAARTFDSDP